jgi:hypothetical protein
MQEHIRRAHPEHYIAKLPATEESFLLMISTSPSERPQPQPTSAPQSHAHQTKGPSHGFRRDESNGAGTPRRYEEYSGGAMFPAAAALAQLHSHKSDAGWESDGVSSCPLHGYSPYCAMITNSRPTGLALRHGRDEEEASVVYRAATNTAAKRRHHKCAAS